MSFEKRRNVVLNGGFEQGRQFWTLWKEGYVQAKFTTGKVENDSTLSAEIKINQIDTTRHAVLMLFQNMSIYEDKIYKISFHAEVQNRKGIAIGFLGDTSIYSQNQLILYPEKRHYGPFYFQSNIEDELSGKFAIWVDQDTVDIVFDDIVAVEHNLRDFDLEVIPKNDISIYSPTNPNALKLIFSENRLTGPEIEEKPDFFVEFGRINEEQKLPVELKDDISDPKRKNVEKGMYIINLNEQNNPSNNRSNTD
ncbi:MAG TPA: hypothetical protein DDY13_04445 [Cytophagales bacterium]|nr:hypothetical protein [Cytophagales bacterium]